jgi:hypothetical protein
VTYPGGSRLQPRPRPSSPRRCGGDAFQWPVQLRQIALILLLIGLLIVLVLAWYHGDRGQQLITTFDLRFSLCCCCLVAGRSGTTDVLKALQKTPGRGNVDKPPLPHLAAAQSVPSALRYGSIGHTRLPDALSLAGTVGVGRVSQTRDCGSDGKG